jgi:hypothetical protein
MRDVIVTTSVEEGSQVTERVVRAILGVQYGLEILEGTGRQLFAVKNHGVII